MNRLRQRRLRFGGGFSPLSLFAGGAEGAWFDPSDLTTLFQDAAGTTPVTTSGQPVGLMFDKSKGLVLGPELITNGTFPVNVAGWSTAGGLSGQVRDTIIFPSGGILITSNGSLGSFTSQTLTGLVVGQTYQVACNAYTPGTNAGTDTATIGTQNQKFTLQGTALKPGRDVVQNLSIVFVASGASQVIYLSVVSSDFLMWGNNGSESYFDNISVRELPGNHATQATGAARPTYTEGSGLAWLAFDGTGDAMATGNIDFTGTEKINVFASVRKLSDAGVGMIAELATGTEFFMAGPQYVGQPDYSFRSTGSIGVEALISGFSAPTTDVITGIGDIAGDSVSIRVNGALRTTNTGDQGSGNFSNSPIFIGARNQSSFFFTGNLYGFVARGALSTAAEIAATEAYLAAKSGVTL